MPRVLDGKFYTYIICTPDMVPYYVGYGTWRRMGEYPYSNEEAKKIMMDLRASGEKHVRVSLQFDTATEAQSEERILIARYGRRVEGGLLVNKNYGGTAHVKLSGRVYSGVDPALPNGYEERDGGGTGKKGQPWSEARRAACQLSPFSPEAKIQQSRWTREGFARKRAERETNHRD